MLAWIIASAARILIIFWFFVTHYADNVFEKGIWAVLGWIFLPLSTCGYIFLSNEYAWSTGCSVILVCLIIVDLVIHARLAASRRISRRRRARRR